MSASARSSGSKWIVRPEPRPDAPTILVCVPYAGGSASIFRDWPAGLPEVDVLAVQPPGREGRFHEPPLRRLRDVVTALTPELDSRLDRPFALFGHSVGALVAFELARALRRRRHAAPSCLLVSACRAPHVPAPRRASDVSEEELEVFAGVPGRRRGRAKLLELMLPVLRANLELAETYEHRPERPLECRIVAFRGAGDADVSPEDVAAWRHHTEGSFAVHVLRGGHLFLHSEAGPLLGLVAREVSAPPRA